jgi:hypothetical protein
VLRDAGKGAVLTRVRDAQGCRGGVASC